MDLLFYLIGHLPVLIFIEPLCTYSWDFFDVKTGCNGVSCYGFRESSVGVSEPQHCKKWLVERARL